MSWKTRIPLQLFGFRILRALDGFHRVLQVFYQEFRKLGLESFLRVLYTGLGFQAVGFLTIYV